jgi:hypothetical protein
MSKKPQATHLWKSMPAELWASFLEVRILSRVEEDPRTSVGGIAAAELIGFPLVWRISH